MEKEKVLRLEETVSDLGSKHSNDQKDLFSLHNKLIGLENDLKQAIQEKSIHEETLKERLCQTKKLLKSLKKYQDAAVQKVLMYQQQVNLHMVNFQVTVWFCYLEKLKCSS